jgi:MYXO-CTERM domain-containing protein
MRISLLLSATVLGGTLGANAQVSVDPASKTAFVRSLRDRFVAKPYEKPTRRSLRYQVWGGGRNFVTVVDDSGDFENGNWFSDSAVEQRLTNVLDKYYETQPDTAQFVVFFSTFQVPFPGAFYLPLSNDVRGIGYRHSFFGGRETFDSTPGSPLEGLLLMNDFRIWDDLGGLSVVFNQELGHRWGAFVHFKEEGATGDSAELLGRDESHWSFFMNTGGSPMEGNAWQDNGDGTFTSVTHRSDFAYHPIDLYAMGLLPASEVPSVWIIEQPDLSALGGFGRRITRETGPLFDRQISIGGVRKEVTIEDVVRSEGPRSPSFDTAPKNFKIGFVVVMQRGQQTNQSLIDEVDAAIDNVVDGWQVATGSRATLQVVSSGPTPPTTKNLGEGCEGFFECSTEQTTACIAPKANPSVGKQCSKRCSAADPCPDGFCCAGADLIGEPRYCFARSLENVCPAPLPDAGTPAPDAGTPTADGGTTAPASTSGGCGIAGTAPSGALWMLLALGALWIRRRRATRC